MKKTTFALIISMVFAVLIISGCTDNKPAGQPAGDFMQPVIVKEVSIGEILYNPTEYGNIQITGVVQQTMDVERYTYTEITDSTGSIWIASTSINLVNGSQITATGSPMTSFYSATLDRTFDVIIFAEMVSEGTTSTSNSPNGSDSMIIGDINVTSIEGGIRIEDIKAELKDQEVKVAAVVVKVVELKNETFLTLEDGTGQLKATMSNSLQVNEGNSVVVTGTVLTDVDYGMGYYYPVLLQITELE